MSLSQANARVSTPPDGGNAVTSAATTKNEGPLNVSTGPELSGPTPETLAQWKQLPSTVRGGDAYVEIALPPRC